jgi:PAS domain S-box-containing protein
MQTPEPILKALDSSTGTIVFTLDKDYRYTYFTKTHQQIMKKIWNADIVVGADMLSFLQPPDREKAKHNFDRALAGEHFTKVEEYGDEKLQRSYWEDRYDPIANDAGEIIGLVVFVLDVSKHILTSHQLGEAQNRLKLALNVSKTGVWEWAVGSPTINWSDELYDIFQVPKNSLITFDFYQQLLHPSDREWVLSTIQNSINSKQDYHFKHRIIWPDKTVRWIYAVGSVLIDSNGNAERFLGTANDITEREKVNQENRDRQIRYDLIVKSSGQMIYDYNVETGKILWAGSTQEILGFSIEEMGDIDRWSKLIHPDDEKYVTNALAAARESLSKFDVIYRFRTSDGHYKTMSDRGFFFHDDDAKIGLRMLGTMEDITAEEEAEQALHEKNDALTKANQELDRFVYSASHDLRAPIASLLGLIKVARLEKSVEAIDLLLNLQEKSLIKLDTFIRDIVDQSRNARMPIAAEEIDCKKMIDAIFEQFHFLESLPQIRKYITIEQSHQFKSDSRRIEIVLKNLISNAIKYADLNKPDPTINIHVKINLNQALITVADNGEGIVSELKNKIFDMFFRASEKSNGSGLGLYIVKEVLEKLNGYIDVKSEFGLGSSFAVVIPNIIND